MWFSPKPALLRALFPLVFAVSLLLVLLAGLGNLTASVEAASPAATTQRLLAESGRSAVGSDPKDMARASLAISPGAALVPVICRCWVDTQGHMTYTTLQAAVDSAAVGSVIEIAEGSCSGVDTRAGVTQTIYISKSLTLRGGYDYDTYPPVQVPNGTTTLDATAQGRVVYVTGPAGTNVTLERLELQDGDATVMGLDGNGGAVYVGGANLLLQNSELSDSQAVRGGALYATGTGSVQVLNTTFTNHSASQDGGALYLDVNQVTLTANNFSGNSATQQGGAFYLRAATVTGSGNGLTGNQAATGGGGYLRDVTTGSLSGGNVADNHATANAGALFFDNADATISGASFLSNTAQMNGGALYLTNGSFVSVGTGSQLQYNRALTGRGGALYLSSAGTTTLGASNLADNRAALDGGALFTTGSGSVVINATTTLANNVADTGDGGALYLNSTGTTTLNDADLTNNRAGSDGGAIYATSAGILTINAGSTLFSNHAAAGHGGALYLSSTSTTVNGTTIFSNTTQVNGGGVYATGTGSVQLLAGSTLEENVATTGSGGGLYRSGGAAAITASAVQDNRAQVEGGALYLSGVSATLNSATVNDNQAGTHGGAILATAGGSLLIENNSVVQGNEALTGSGGAISVSGTGTTINNSDLLNNTAQVNGGALAVSGAAVALQNTSRLADNVATTGSGGALHAVGGTVTSTSATVEDNQAQNHGGAFFLQDVTTSSTLGGALFTHNGALTGSGGALYLQNSVVRLNNSDAISNTAQVDGGGLYATSTSNVTLENTSVLQDNLATTGNGGGLYTSGGTVSLVQASLTANVAQGNGGGLLATGGATVGLSGASAVTGNRALTGSGGGIIATGGGTLSLTGSSVANNIAEGHGGGLYLDVAQATLTTNSLTGNRSNLGRGGAVNLRATTSATVSGNTVSNNRAESHGGGFFVLDFPALTLTNNQWNNNLAATGSGGGLYLQNSTVTLDGNTLDGNSAEQSGGGLYAGTASHVTFSNSSHVTNNSATTGSGGGVYVTGGSATVNDTEIRQNQAAQHGGGLYASSTAGTVTGSEIRDNSSEEGSGGGLYLRAPTVTVSTSTIEGNSSTKRGGGVYLANATAATLDGNVIRDNLIPLQVLTYTFPITQQVYITVTETTTGGEVITHVIPIDQPSTVTTREVVSDSGGGLYMVSSVGQVTNNEFRGNSASAHGGGLYLDSSTIGMVNNLVVQNQVTLSNSQGSGVYLLNSAATITHNTIADNSNPDVDGDSAGLYVTKSGSGNSTLAMRNSIVAGHEVGLFLLLGTTATLDGMLWDNDRMDWGGNGTYSGEGKNLRGDPRFVSASDYHLQRTSAAFDIGVATGVTTDRDGTPRPRAFGLDAGAYEHRYVNGVHLKVDALQRFVSSGQALTYIIRVANHSANPLSNVQVNSALPAQQSLVTISSSMGSCGGSNCTLGLMAPGSSATITLTTQVNGAGSPTGFVTMVNNVTVSSPDLGTSDTGGTLASYLQLCRVQLRGQDYPTIQAAVDASIPNDIVRVSGYCGGLNSNGGKKQAVYLTKRITIQGGWDATMTTMDPASPSTVDVAGLGRVMFIGGDVQPRIENLNLVNGSASGLGGGPTGKDAGGGVYLTNAIATLTNTHIFDSHSADYGGGLYINRQTVARLENSSLHHNTAGESGGGAYLNDTAATLINTEIYNNSAVAGGGLFALKGTATVESCNIHHNSASGQPRYLSVAGFTLQTAVGGGGGVALEESAITLVTSTLADNSATVGGGLYANNSPAAISKSIIRDNEATATPVYSPGTLIAAGGGGGIYGQGSPLQLFNNQITHNVAAGDGGGLHIYNTTAAVKVDGNVLAFNDAGRGSAMFLHFKPAPPQFFVPPFTFPDFLLPILLGQPQPNPPRVRMQHNTIAHNLGTHAVFVWGETYPDLVNSLVAFNQGAAVQVETEVVPYVLYLLIPFPPFLIPVPFPTYHAPDANLDYTLWYQNGSDTVESGLGATLTSQNSISGQDPALKDDGFHIKRVSAAFEAGSNSSVGNDIDDEPRLQGNRADIGADEYPYIPVVRYVAPGGTGSAPCDAFQTPCGSLQVALDAADPGDLIKLAAGTHNVVATRAGHTQIGYVTKNVTIRGGYSPTTGGTHTPLDWEVYNPVANVTTLNAQGAGRGFYITDGAVPIIEGLRVTGGNAVGQGGGPGGVDAGGGVYIINASPTITNVQVSSNQATVGGGFYLTGGNARIFQNVVSGNVASVGGGGFYLQVDNSQVMTNTISGNSATDGGGLYLSATSSEVTTNTVQSNSATSGGGVYVIGSDATVHGNLITNNDGTNGGGVYLRSVSQLDLTENSVTNNAATGAGGGFYLDGSTLTIAGHTVTGNTAASDGGGFFLIGFSAATLQDNTVVNNTATRDGGGFFIRLSDATLDGNNIRDNNARHGAGLYVKLSNVPLLDNTIRDNSALFDGGGMYLDESTLTVSNMALTGNSARSGGGLYLLRSHNARLTNLTVSDNSALINGGGVYLQLSDIPVTAVLAAGNSAGNTGGGFYLNQSLAIFNRTRFIGNSAATGGGLALANGSHARLNNTVVLENSATSTASGVLVHSSSPTLLHSTLSENTGGNGAGVHIADDGVTTSGVTMTNSIIVGHTIGVYAAANNSATVRATLWGIGSTANTINTSGPGSIATVTNVQGAPVFDPDGYHIREESAAVDRGVATPLLEDIDEDERPEGAAADIGADEFGGESCYAQLQSTAITYATIQEAVNLAAPNDLVKVAGTCQGVNSQGGLTQTVYLNVSLTIQGGYTTTNWVVSDPIQNPTLVDAESEGRVLYITGNITPTISNITLTGGDALGLGGGPGGTTDGGGGVYIVGAQVLLTNTRVLNNNGQYGAGIYVNSPATSIINSTVAGNLGTRGGGIFADGTPVIVQGSTIRANDVTGDGAGLFLSASAAEILTSTLSLNTADSAGGALYAEGSPATIQGNTVTTNSAQYGGGLYLDASQAILDGNRVEANSADNGGGIYLESSPALLDSNVILGNSATNGGGLYLELSGARAVNNIIAQNQASAVGSGIYNLASSPDFLHSTIAANTGGVGIGVFVEHSSPVFSTMRLTNTIISDHEVGLTVKAGDTAILNGTVWYNNVSHWSGPGVVDTNNDTFGDPNYVNASAGDYHIEAPSTAVDSGVASGVPEDIDNDARPVHTNYDVGADEFYQPGLNATLVSFPTPVLAGAFLSYTVSVQNTGNVALHGDITVTLPSQVIPNQPITWTNITIGTSTTWQQEVRVRVAPNYQGPLNASMVVTTDEGVSDSASNTTQAVQPNPGMNITGSASPSPARPGNRLTYQVVVQNTGNEPLNVTITGTLPSGVTPEPNAPVPPWTASIAPGNSFGRSFNVTVHPDVTGMLEAYFRVTAPTTAHGMLVDDVTVSTPVRVLGVDISQSTDPYPAIAGSALDFTIHITNTSNVVLNATITDTLPSQVTPNGTDVWTEVIQPGDHITRVIPVSVQQGYIGTLINHVQVATTQGVSDEDIAVIPVTLPYASPTITAVMTGTWGSPITWEDGRLPGSTDVVLIPEGIEVIVPEAVTVSGVNNFGILRGAPHLVITATDFIYNGGQMLGGDGVVLRPHGGDVDLRTALLDNQGLIKGGSGAAANPDGGSGGAVVVYTLAPDHSILNTDTLQGGEGGYSPLGRGGVGGSVVLVNPSGTTDNTGFVLGGRGGDGDSGGGAGGNLSVMALRVTYSNEATAGDGGNVTGLGTGTAGDGGLVQILGNYNQCPTQVTIAAQVTAGHGGQGNPASTVAQVGGTGGRIHLMGAPTLRLNQSQIVAGRAGLGAGGGTAGLQGSIGLTSGDSVQCGGTPTLSLAGTGTLVEGGYVRIFGGTNLLLDLKNMSPGAIRADRLLMSGGEGSTLDLRSNTGQIAVIASTGSVGVSSVQLPSGWSLAQMMGTNTSVTSPRFLYGPALVGRDRLMGLAGQPLTLDIALVNRGPVTDTFNLTLTASEDWPITGLPSSAVVSGSRMRDIRLTITPPALLARVGTVNIVDIQATSVGEPSRVSLMRVYIIVDESGHALYLPILER